MARLVLELGGEEQTFAVTERGLTIGRALDNDIVLNNAIVSRRHARVELRGNEPWVVDADSRNGVFLNRLRVSRGAAR